VVEARQWQREALRAWESAGRGIVSVVTGGGKTFFALLVLEQLWIKQPETRVLVLVPSIALQDQWLVESAERFPARSVQAWGSRNSHSGAIVVMVMNSARMHAAELLASPGPWILVVDECHRLATPENAKALQIPTAFALGLSATPERQHDRNTEELLYPVLGAVIYSYDYRQALTDGVIVPYVLENYRISMTEEEDQRYARLTRRIAVLLGSGQTMASEPVKRALLARARHVQNLSGRVPAAVGLIDRQPRVRALVFHESTSAAEGIAEQLLARGHRAVTYHSGIPSVRRRQALFEFRSGMKDVLVCCRALDEGLNVPRTELAVVASGTASARQRIQRLGRVLRPHVSKDRATVATVYATDSERVSLEAEAEHMLGLVDARWYGVRS
jgi:superfamily II DNA or RNA helicase